MEKSALRYRMPSLEGVYKFYVHACNPTDREFLPSKVCTQDVGHCGSTPRFCQPSKETSLEHRSARPTFIA